MRVTLVLTHDCNLACDYCYTGEKFARSMPEKVAWEALRLAFRQSRTQSERLCVSYFGGEPLLEFAAMARYTRKAHQWALRHQRPIEFQVTTNATIMSQKILDFFQRYPFRIAFSVDGLNTDHDRHRPFVSGRASSPVVWKNLEQAAGKLGAHIHIVVNPDTLNGLTATIQRLHELNYRDITLLPNMDAVWDAASRALAREVYHSVSELQAEQRELMVSPLIDMELEQPRLKACGFGSDDVAVSPTGALYPCARLVGTDQREPLHLGHVKTGVDETKVKTLKARARAKQAGCGSEGGCACATFMPGNVIRQLDNTRFFNELNLSLAVQNRALAVAAGSAATALL
ncbi:MAG: radical SAM protein [Candidatus Eremiobacteraeota bacterium]|nr:radical SAM protein [Candidatus Eremiobacteraeota bacterium]